MFVPPGANQCHSQKQLVDIVKEHCLNQVVDIPTRQDKTLDLLLTNNPVPVNRVKTLPPIGKADHDIVLLEYDIKSKRVRQTPRKIYLYKRADMDGLKSHLGQYRDNILALNLDSISTNDLWTDFKTEITKAMDKFVPSKMT